MTRQRINRQKQATPNSGQNISRSRDSLSARAVPATLHPAALRGLQRTVGNRAVHRLLLQRQENNPDNVLSAELFRNNATLQDVATGTRTLGDGDEGTAVSRVQRALILNGHDMDPYGADGDFGGTTAGAVRAFQDARDDLETTGEIDAATLLALDRLPSTQNAPVGVRPVHLGARSRGRAFMLDWDAEHRRINQDDTLREAFDRNLTAEIARFFGEELTVDQVVARIEQAENEGRDDEALEMRENLSKANQFAVVETLDVENSDRYARVPNGATYCNIYSYDVVTALGGYLPRVWWTDDAIERLEAGEDVAVRYDDTVREMNANSLTGWMGDYGGDFGWRQAADVDEAQEAANQGRLVILLAANPGGHGHVNVVMPEVGENTALRGDDGQVEIPMQSQAGGTNFQYQRSGGRWWADPDHEDGAAWIFEGAPDSPLTPPERLGRRSDMRVAELEVQMDVTDSDLLQNERESFDISRQINLVPGADDRRVHIQECVGGEVVVDLSVGLSLSDDATITGALQAQLFEGTSCTPDDLEAIQVLPLAVGDGGETAADIELTNPGLIGTDRAAIHLSLRNSNE